MKKKAVVLNSGGLDSATVLAFAKAEGFEIYALSFDYGQKHHAELRFAKHLAEINAVAKHEILKLDFGRLGGSALTDDNIAVPDYSGDAAIPVTYVPARNTIFLSYALGWAEILDAQAIFTGVSAVDFSGYPDCRPEFIAAFERLANVATKMGVEGNKITIHTPLLHLNKAQTIALGLSLGVDYSQTVSCYRANERGEACGACDSCMLRKKGFADAGIEDPTRYVD